METLRGIKDIGSPAENFAMGVFGFMQGLTDQIGTLKEVNADVAYMKILMVNVCFVGAAGNHTRWVLIDCGLPDSADIIIEAAEERYGSGCRPEAIILTHGHFDHVGAARELVEHWNVKAYAHKMELPYLTGEANYLPPDPSVDDGMMAKIAPLYPHAAINLGNYVKTLPEDGGVPGLEEWRWLHTPGHTEGHISLFRERDRVLLAGDAFTTVRQESAIAVISQAREVNGPPKYFTTDWQSARQSVKELEALGPSVVITGHGKALSGKRLSNELKNLARHFDELAMPAQGRYLH